MLNYRLSNGLGDSHGGWCCDGIHVAGQKSIHLVQGVAGLNLSLRCNNWYNDRCLHNRCGLLHNLSCLYGLGFAVNLSKYIVTSFRIAHAG